MSATDNSFSADQLHDLGYSNRLGMFNANSIAGLTLPIMFRWHENDCCYLIVQEPGQPLPGEYCLDWLLKIDGTSYVVLCFPPPIQEDEPVPTQMVLQVVDRNSLVGISESAFLKIAPTIVEETKNGARTAYRLIDAAFGPFPTWEEAKETVISLLSEKRS